MVETGFVFKRLGKCKLQLCVLVVTHMYSIIEYHTYKNIALGYLNQLI